MSEASSSKRLLAADNFSQSPAAKKKRASSSLESYVDLHDDALSLVMEFLPPRELLSMAFTCKTLRSKITVPLVVRSAMIHGKHAKNTIEELSKLMEAHAIHPPSALRLLRLVNGKRCEFCCQAKVNHVRPNLGVFACWGCVTAEDQALTKIWNTRWVRFQTNCSAYSAILNHPRVATGSEYSGKFYLWRKPQADQSGEAIGPLVSFTDVDKMLNRVEDYLQNTLRVPPKEEYGSFHQTYQEMEERARLLVFERYEKEQTAKKQKQAARRAKVDAMIEDLKVLLDEPFRDGALEKTDLDYQKIRDRCILFHLPLVEQLMVPFICTPSKLKKKTLREIADKINTTLRLINDKYLLSFDFLDESSPFEAMLKERFRAEFTSVTAVLGANKVIRCGPRNNTLKVQANCDSKVFELLEKDRLLAALVSLKGNDLSLFLLGEGESRLAPLAKNVWTKCLKDAGSDQDDSRFGRAFEASKTPFELAKEILEQYVPWIQRKYPDDSWHHKERRSFAADQVLKDAKYLPFLETQDFEGLDKQQDIPFDVYWDRITR